MKKLSTFARYCRVDGWCREGARQRTEPASEEVLRAGHAGADAGRQGVAVCVDPTGILKLWGAGAGLGGPEFKLHWEVWPLVGYFGGGDWQGEGLTAFLEEGQGGLSRKRGPCV